MGNSLVRKDYAVLGLGNIGKNIAQDLIDNRDQGQKISVYDPFVKSDALNQDGVTFYSTDPFGADNAKEIFNRDTVVISALPPKLMEKVYDYAIRLGGNLIDIASVHFDITELLKKDGDFLIIPECGIAPGITNFLVGHFTSEFEIVDEVKIYVGGIPDKPIPPLEYKVTWSPTALVNMYLNPVEIYENGSLRVVEPLTGIEEFEIDGFGYPLEAFYTDGLSTLKYTEKDVKRMYEKTVRYKGHADKISLLKKLGYLDIKEIELSNQRVKPRDLTEALFNENLRSKEVGDALLMRVVVEGRIGQRRAKKQATLVHRVDSDSPFTAMSKTTGFPPSIIAQMIAKGEISDLKGYLPPQRLGRNEEIFGNVIKELARRGIDISINENDKDI